MVDEKRAWGDEPETQRWAQDEDETNEKSWLGRVRVGGQMSG